MSGGFFSLNRFLGRKHKNRKTSKNNNIFSLIKISSHNSFFIASNGSTKSSVQAISRSTANLEVISPQNQITPLTTVHNAPFEQTFRITVYLPLQQLYVTRIGAKTKLMELLNKICMNKSLDSNKFEFRHPSEYFIASM